MTTMHKTAILVALCLSLSACVHGGRQQDWGFIYREGHRLMEAGQEFRFAGIHAPELHRIEQDSLGPCPQDPRGWGQHFTWPSAREQENWIKALTRSGHRAMRIYVLSVASPYDQACGRQTHILPPATAGGLPRLNEEAMVVYDNMIALAHKHRLRLILPFIDHWQWWGGREQLAAFYGESPDDLHDIHSKTYAAYLSIIKQVVTRKNTVTGRLYKDEPAIMAWETGNELKHSTQAFVTRTAAYIKALDSKHLVVDGTYLKVNSFSLDDPNIDIISNHFYTTNGNNKPETIEQDLKAIAGKKVYLVGEFGLSDAANIGRILNAAVHTEVDGARAAGALVWGFRGHREEGGFYWHKEYTGHYSYHLPGFEVNASNEEQEVVALVRQAQAQMAGLDKAKTLPAPEAPWLHSIADPSIKIAWMGSPLGQSYRIERADKPTGPWTVVGNNISDGVNEFDPRHQVLFKDVTFRTCSMPCYYRVIAINEGGESPPSNIEAVLRTAPPAIKLDSEEANRIN